MKTSYIIILSALLTLGSCLESRAQISISTDGNPADPTAMLDIRSSGKGLLIPHLSVAEIQAISNPANSLLVYCTSDDRLYAFVSGENKWKSLSYGTSTLIPDFYCGNNFTDSRDGAVYSTVQASLSCILSLLHHMHPETLRLIFTR